MTTIANHTPTTSWADWLRRKAIAMINMAASLRHEPATAADLEGDMRVHAAEMELQKRKSLLSAGSYIGWID